ncbi:MAG: RnfH family protein [Rhodoferax sp.]
MRVCVVWAPAPRQVDIRHVNLPAAATVGQAIVASGVLAGADAQRVDTLSVSVWGRRCALDQILREGDRVELTRPLRVDPKVARRERYGRQGPGAAGLFKKRRPGAQPGA